MIEIKIEEYQNGYGVSIYESQKYEPTIKEIHMEYISVLKLLANWLDKEVKQEMKIRQSL